MDAEQPKMTRAEFDRLLSAYSSGSIRDDERETLFQAAMEDQKFFNALADEESLRDVLQDPDFAAELRRELSPPQKRLFWLRPWPLITAGTLAAIVVGTFFFWRAQIPLTPGMVANRVGTPEVPTAAAPPPVAAVPDVAAKKAAKKPVAARKAEAPAPAAALPETTPPAPPEPAPAAPPPKPALVEDQRQQVMAAPPPAGVARAEPRLSPLRESVQLDTTTPQRVYLTSRVSSLMGKPLQHALANGVLTVTAHRDGYLYVLALTGGEWKVLESGAQITSGVSRPIRVAEASQAIIALTQQTVSDPTPANLRMIPGAFVETVNIR